MDDKKEDNKLMDEVKKHRCVKCGSLFGYLRIKDKTWVCRSCGNMDKEVVV